MEIRATQAKKFLEEGDKVKVKLLEVDPRTGKFKLSRKALMPKPEAPAKPQPDNN